MNAKKLAVSWTLAGVAVLGLATAGPALAQDADDARVTAALAAALQDAAADVREQAAWALGRMRAEGVAEALVGALDDEDAGVRRQALWALGQVRDEGAVDALVAALEDDDPEVRRMAAAALAQVYDGRGAFFVNPNPNPNPNPRPFGTRLPRPARPAR